MKTTNRNELERSIRETTYRYLLAFEEVGRYWSDDYGAYVVYHFDHDAFLKDGRVIEWIEVLEDDDVTE